MSGFNAEQFVIDFGLRYDAGGTNNATVGSVTTLCPFCGNDDWCRLGIFENNNATVHCWRCGNHSMLKAIQVLLNVNYHKAKSIRKDYTVKGNSFADRTSSEYKDNIGKIKIPGGKLTKYHRRYLKRRGFDPDFLVEKYKITGTGPNTYYNNTNVTVDIRTGKPFKPQNFSNSIIIPVFDQSGRVLSFQGRSIETNPVERYRGLRDAWSIFHYKRSLYNIQNIKSGTVFVLEGALDVWNFGPEAVATYGTTLKASQLNMLKQFNEIIFLFDDEEEAQEHADDYCRTLAMCGKDARSIACDFGLGAKGNPRDIGDLSKKEIKQLRKQLEIGDKVWEL